MDKKTASGKKIKLRLWHRVVLWLLFFVLTVTGISINVTDVVRYAGYYSYSYAEPEKAGEPGEQKKFIRWAEFNVPYAALERAMNYDIKAKKEGKDVSWIQMLSLLATKYGGNWKRYGYKDLDALYNKLKAGESVENITKSKYYQYFYDVYTAVLSEFIGRHKIEVIDPADKAKKIVSEKYGLKVFSPIAAGYAYSEYDDFGNSRNYGYKRRHLGHDMMGRIGTPVIAVEGGVIAECGWNQYGGWRVGVRSFDTKRYYYYAHLRKDHPYAKGIEKGATVKAGDVIGYLGMTGYSAKENVNNINVPHLHFGLQLIFDESQVKGPAEIWVDVYALTNLLKKNKMVTVYQSGTKDHERKYNFL